MQSGRKLQQIEACEDRDVLGGLEGVVSDGWGLLVTQARPGSSPVRHRRVHMLAYGLCLWTLRQVRDETEEGGEGVFGHHSY